MRALTLRLPWAVLVVTGRKRIESRRGPVLNRHAGPFAVHVSKRSPGWEQELERLAELFGLSEDDMRHPFSGLRTEDLGGHVIGTVIATNTTRETPLFPADDRARDGAVFDDLAGRYLTGLVDPAWLPTPIPARGSLGLWDAPMITR